MTEDEIRADERARCAADVCGACSRSEHYGVAKPGRSSAQPCKAGAIWMRHRTIAERKA